MNSLGDFLHDLTIEALAECTERQRRAYQLVHGITVTGLHAEPCTVTEAARLIDAPRQNVTNDLAHARAAVYERIAKYLIVQYTMDEAAEQMPALGTATTVSHDEARYFMHTGERTEQRITLGPGSRAMESAGKHSRYADARSATIRAHQTYAREGAR